MIARADALMEWLRWQRARASAYVTVRIDRWVYDRRYNLPNSASQHVEVDITRIASTPTDRRAYGAGVYRASPWGVLRRALDRTPVSDKDVFIDLGSGYGRMLLEAATMPFGKVIGVEIAEEFNAVARQAVRDNLHRLACQCVEVVTADVMEYQLPDDVTVIYMYEPFQGPVLRHALDEILQSVRRNPRLLRIVAFADEGLGELPHVRLIGFGRRRFMRFAADPMLRLYAIDPAAVG